MSRIRRLHTLIIFQACLDWVFVNSAIWSSFSPNIQDDARRQATGWAVGDAGGVEPCNVLISDYVVSNVSQCPAFPPIIDQPTCLFPPSVICPEIRPTSPLPSHHLLMTTCSSSCVLRAHICLNPCKFREKIRKCCAAWTSSWQIVSDAWDRAAELSEAWAQQLIAQQQPPEFDHLHHSHNSGEWNTTWSNNKHL